MEYVTSGYDVTDDMEYCTLDAALERLDEERDGSSDDESVHTSDEECSGWEPCIDKIKTERDDETELSDNGNAWTNVNFDESKNTIAVGIKIPVNDGIRGYEPGRLDILTSADIRQDVVNHANIKPTLNTETNVQKQKYIRQKVRKKVKTETESVASDIDCKKENELIDESKCESEDVKTTAGANILYPQSALFPKEYKCDLCNKKYSHRASLLFHKKAHRKYSAADTSDKGSFPCKYCGKLFQKENNLQLHLQIHEGTSKHNCEVCGFKFSRKTDLKRHMFTHTGETPYTCSLCGKGFRQSGEFNRYKAYHRGENKCKYCGKVYMRKVELIAHLAKHEQTTLADDSNETFFHCTICPKILKSEFNLKQHISVVHCNGGCPAPVSAWVSQRAGDSNKEIRDGDSNNEIALKCQHCPKTFSTNSNRRRHERNTHSNSQSRCDICGKVFKALRNLKEHIKYTHVETEFTCSVCDAVFASDKSMRNHKKEIHR